MHCERGSFVSLKGQEKANAYHCFGHILVDSFTIFFFMLKYFVFIIQSYIQYMFTLLLCSILFVLLDVARLSLVPHTCTLVGSCILDANTSCILHWLCVGHAIDHCDWSLLHCMSG